MSNIYKNGKNKPTFDYFKRFENVLREGLTKEPYTIDSILCINQGNYLGNTLIHLAAEELNLPHLRLLIKSPGVNLGLLNLDNRNIVHLILMNLQKRWSTQRSQAAAEKRLCCRNPAPNEVFSVLSEIFKVISLLDMTAVISVLTMRDRYELSPLDYAISLNNVSLIGLLISEIRLSSDSVDWGRLLNRAILTNVSETVAAVASHYVHYYEQVILVIDECSIPTMSSGIARPSGAIKVDKGNRKPVDFIIQAIKHECSKSLHCLLLIPTFQLRINDSSSLETDGNFREQFILIINNLYKKFTDI
jgi:hypothetical protein